MGLFDKIFEKKACDICGKEVGLLGNRKLEDGNMCKDCTKLLSPWFEERRHSTVDEIRGQLKIREENKKLLNVFFKSSKTYGDDDKMHVMYYNGTPCCFVVAKTNNYIEENADIITFDKVISCTLDIKDSRTEVKYTNSQNERVSYNPPRYEYRYEFYVVLGITGFSYIDEIRFKLNKRTVKFETDSLLNSVNSNLGRKVMAGLNMDIPPAYNAEYQRYRDMYKDIETEVTIGRNNPYYPDKLQNAGQTEQENSENATPVTEGQVVYRKFCPNCGAKGTGGKFCAECGQPMTVNES